MEYNLRDTEAANLRSMLLYGGCCACVRLRPTFQVRYQFPNFLSHTCDRTYDLFAFIVSFCVGDRWVESQRCILYHKAVCPRWGTSGLKDVIWLFILFGAWYLVLLKCFLTSFLNTCGLIRNLHCMNCFLWNHLTLALVIMWFVSWLPLIFLTSELFAA